MDTQDHAPTAHVTTPEAVIEKLKLKKKMEHTVLDLPKNIQQQLKLMKKMISTSETVLGAIKSKEVEPVSQKIYTFDEVHTMVKMLKVAMRLMETRTIEKEKQTIDKLVTGINGQISEVIDKGLETIKETIKQTVSEKCVNVDNNKKSYSDIVKQAVYSGPAKKKGANKERVIFVKPSDKKSKMDGSAILKRVQGILKGRYHLSFDLIKEKDNCVLVIGNEIRDAEAIKSLIKKDHPDLIAEHPKKKNPRIMIRGINIEELFDKKDMTDDAILDLIIKQNKWDELNKDGNEEIKLLTGFDTINYKKKQERNIVISVPGVIRDSLESSDGKVKVNFQMKKIEDTWNLPICTKCLSHDGAHRSKVCPEKQRCKKCGDHHKESECKRVKPICRHCKDAKFDYDHHCMSRECPFIQMQIERAMSVTDYVYKQIF